MGITVEHQPELRRRIQTVTGKISLEEIRDVLTGVYGDPSFDPDADVLWDLRDADLAGFSSSDIRRIADLVAGSWSRGGGSRAALVVSGILDFGLARMYEMMLDSRTQGAVRVMTDLDEALAWLDEKGPQRNPTPRS